MPKKIPFCFLCQKRYDCGGVRWKVHYVKSYSLGFVWRLQYYRVCQGSWPLRSKERVPACMRMHPGMGVTLTSKCSSLKFLRFWLLCQSWRSNPKLSIQYFFVWGSRSLAHTVWFPKYFILLHAPEIATYLPWLQKTESFIHLQNHLMLKIDSKAWLSIKNKLLKKSSRPFIMSFYGI